MRRRYDAQFRWLLRRLTPGGYLGLHLTVGLLAAGGSLWLFGGLVEDLLTGDPIVRFDRVLDDYLHSHATPHLTTFFLIVTAFGSTVAVVLLGVVVAALLAWRRLWTLLWTWIAAVAGSALIDWLAEGHLPEATAPLRAPLGGRVELLLPQRPRDGVLRRLRDAGLPRRTLA